MILVFVPRKGNIHIHRNRVDGENNEAFEDNKKCPIKNPLNNLYLRDNQAFVDKKGLD